MAKGVISQDEVRKYHEDGFLLIKEMLSPEEIGLLGRAAREDRILDQQSYGQADGEGGTVRLSLWNHPTDTIYGAVARCESIVGSAEKLLGDEVYHYHSKMIMKDAKVGGAWAWHQDYGYWYQKGVLYPDLTSISIAVDKATKENGCLQVIKGSHKLGRIEHKLTGDQAGQTKRASTRFSSAWSLSTSLWTRATPSSSTQTRCTVLTRIAPTTRVGR